MSPVASIIIAVVGSTALGTLIQFFVTRYDNRKKIGEKLTLLEKDGLRTQLLLLILLKPDDKREILTLAEKYFAELKGNWYATPIFDRWCVEHHIEPEWFDKSR